MSNLSIKVSTVFDKTSGLAELRKSLKEIQANNVVNLQVKFDKTQLDQLSKQLKDLYGKVPTSIPSNTLTSQNTGQQSQQTQQLVTQKSLYAELNRLTQKEFSLQGQILVNQKAKNESALTELRTQLDINRARQQQTKNTIGSSNLTNPQKEAELIKRVSANQDALNVKTARYNDIAGRSRDSLNIFQKIGDTITHNVKKMGEWLVAGTLLMGSFRAFKDGIQSVIDLDKAMTNVNMTMGMTSREMSQLTSESQKMAITMGISVASVLEASKVYANANENILSILDKTKASIMLSTASGLNVESSTDSIQAIMNQFELEAEGSSMRIADTLQKISANMAFDFGRGISEISSAIQVSGSIAREAGFELERYEAVVGAIVERTRLAGSQVGNSLKTIFSRLGRAKTGEASDEEISKAEEAYKSIGIALRDIKGEFREIPDVIDELSAKWGTLGSVTKSYISEISAGIR